MNMPPPGQPQPNQQPEQGGEQAQNPIIQAIQLLGQFVERVAQRDPQQAKAAGAALQQFVTVVKGGGKPDAEGPQEDAAEGPQGEQQEREAPAPKPKGAKKMGPMDMNAKKGAVQVL
jgi:hypothetical protein